MVSKRQEANAALWPRGRERVELRLDGAIADKNEGIIIRGYLQEGLEEFDGLFTLMKFTGEKQHAFSAETQFAAQPSRGVARGFIRRAKMVSVDRMRREKEPIRRYPK